MSEVKNVKEIIPGYYKIERGEQEKKAMHILTDDFITNTCASIDSEIIKKEIKEASNK